VYKAEGKFWVNNHAHILKPKGNDYDFMALVLEAADYTLFITGSAQPKLSQANMNAVKLPIPPMEEQREIVAGIKPQLERIDTFIEQRSSIVALLEERKQIIISDVVTGKVKVKVI
jgi:type I restriction enzyme S subunit